MTLGIRGSGIYILSGHSGLLHRDGFCLTSRSIEFACITRSSVKPEAGGWRYVSGQEPRGSIGLLPALNAFSCQVHSACALCARCWHDAYPHNVWLVQAVPSPRPADPSAECFSARLTTKPNF